MIGRAGVEEILTTYKKYGWILRRVLLTKNSLSSLQSTKDLFGEVPISESDVDALWFSRPNKKGRVAWEIRHLSETPYALLEMIDEDDADLEAVLSSIQSRLKENVWRK